MYETITTLSKRATSMGFGKKMQVNDGYIFRLLRIQPTPSPDRYVHPSDFDLSPKKGLSFGAGREDVKFVSIFTKNNNPAPADYNNTKEFPTKEYSMRKKISFPDLFQNSKAPGPGSCI